LVLALSNLCKRIRNLNQRKLAEVDY
jgi:hypothetical protein